MGDGLDVAVVGMALRGPGAGSVEELWENLLSGAVSLSRFDAEDVEIPPELSRMAGGSRHIPVGGVIDGAEHFDGNFFKISPKESDLLDPQHRVFLEVVSQAFEAAAIVPGEAVTGVFAGSAFPSYLLTRLWNSAAISGMGQYWLTVGNDKDHLSTRLAYTLNLTGPAVSVQTACSTSLVALHMACQSLVIGECDLAVAGASAIGFPQHRGYHVVEGGILSPDGICRPFDVGANGTVPSNGVGALVLKRLEDAVADGDPIRAVVRGTALTNDGSTKLSYSSPSARGQVRAVQEALRLADVGPGDVSYIEAHGTATDLGDAVEIAALKEALPGDRPCVVGAVKSNLGHLDVAAGMAGMIKTILALEHEVIPGTANLVRPSPQLQIEDSRFTVTSESTAWPRSSRPRVAGVSSFGLGGTNAHIVLSEAPAPAAPAPAAPAAESGSVILALSAGTQEALANLSSRVAPNPADDLQGIARSLASGRRFRDHRRAVVASSAEEARHLLREPGGTIVGRGRVALVFSGAGKNFSSASAELMSVPAFAVPYRAAEAALIAAGAEVGPFNSGDGPERDQELPTVALPSLFAVQYALARMWESFGVGADAVIGHSNGEFAAAVITGVMNLEAAAQLVQRRADLLTRQAPGKMVALPVDRATAETLAAEHYVHLAARNTPESHVFSGGSEHVDALVAAAEKAGIEARPLGIATAAHSSLLDAARDDLADLAGKFELSKPGIPYYSGLLGGLADDGELSTPDYWGDHMREPVLFAEAVEGAARAADLFVEIGPADSVAPFLLASAHIAPGHVVGSVPAAREETSVARRIRESAGRLWSLGAAVALDQLLEKGPRAAVPSAPFTGPRHFVSVERVPAAKPPRGVQVQEPVWESLPASVAKERLRGRWAVVGGNQLRGRLVERLGADADSVRDAGARVPEDLDLSTLDGLVHLGAGDDGAGSDLEVFDELLDLVHRCAFLDHPVRLAVVREGTADILGSEALDPVAALGFGPSAVAGHELSHLSTRFIDLAPGEPDAVGSILVSLELDVSDPLVAVRGQRGWVRRWRQLEDTAPSTGEERPRAVLITGGLGGIGSALAKKMASEGVGRIALLGRRDLDTGSREADVVAARERLQELRNEGAEVLYLPCDVASSAEVTACVESLKERWGSIDTLVHTAGVPAGGMIANRTTRECAEVLAPKTTGTRNLAKALASCGLRRVLLCSSLDAVLGTFGQVDHVSANAFLDAVPGSGLFGEAMVTSVNWGAWRDVGQAADTSRTGGLEQWRTGMLENAIDTEEGARLGWQCLLSRLPQLAVTAENIDELVARMRTVDLVSLYSEADTARTEVLARPRPLPAHTFSEPDGALEEMLAELWSSVTGISPIGADDDYFAIGGHSLGAIALVSRLRQAFPFPVALTDVLERPTIRKQGEWLQGRLEEYLETLTDEEVEAHLASLDQHMTDN